MNLETHWETVFNSKAPDAVSWYRPHLDLSLDLIARRAPNRSASIIDVGAGESTLVDDLLDRGYIYLTILDISRTAIEATMARLGGKSAHVHGIIGDVTQVALPEKAFDVWHDRAVFHFLVDPDMRQRYVESVIEAVKPGGHVIVGTFGPEGPTKCSGLDVMRYDPEGLHRAFGRKFRVEEHATEVHQTPWGAAQQFIYCCCRIE
jgi:SAM-dependent methyltransferase